MQLASGHWLLLLVYADDVVLLRWSPAGLQLLLDSMNDLCLGLGLVIIPTKTDGRGHILLEVKELPQKGQPNICHLLDVRRQRVRAESSSDLPTI